MLARHASYQRPIGLLGIALAKRCRQLLRGASGAGDDKNAGCIAVEAMHQPRLLALRAGPCFEHLVDIPRHAGPALHGKTGRLVQDDHLVVFMQHHALQKLVIAPVLQIMAGDRRVFRLGVDIERRHAHHLPWLHAGIAFHASAIDAHLTRAQKLLEWAETEPREMRP